MNAKVWICSCGYTTKTGICLNGPPRCPLHGYMMEAKPIDRDQVKQLMDKYEQKDRAA